jgi:hypothetical protein
LKGMIHSYMVSNLIIANKEDFQAINRFFTGPRVVLEDVKMSPSPLVFSSFQHHHVEGEDQLGSEGVRRIDQPAVLALFFALAHLLHYRTRLPSSWMRKKLQRQMCEISFSLLGAMLRSILTKLLFLLDSTLCGKIESKRPYGELGSVDRGNFLCCVAVSSGFGTLHYISVSLYNLSHNSFQVKFHLDVDATRSLSTKLSMS